MAEVASEGRAETERITDQMTELQEAWARLQDEMGKRRQRLNQSDLAQQYYNDADEAEAWIGEQELYMITEEKAKVRRSNTERRESGSESNCFLPLFQSYQLLPKCYFPHNVFSLKK